jgi:hypothetical protein
MAVLELVSWVEATFKIKPDVRDITPENFDSVRRLAAFIRAKTAGGQGHVAQDAIVAASSATQ